VTTVALPRARTVATHSVLTDALFLGTLFSVTFAKLHWTVAGDLSLADVLTALFLVAWSCERIAAADTRLDRTAAIVLGFFVAFLLVYLAGWFNVETQQALTQWGKGLVKFVLHFLFVVAGVAYLARRSERAYWRALAAFMLGIAANAAYGVVQLAVARVGINLDQLVLQPLTRGASAINVYGAVEGQKVYRTNALTGDPNHLGIALIMPLLVLTPIYLRLERRHRLKVPLACLLGFLLIVELSTLSRSGLLGLGVGFLILAVPYRRLLVSKALLVPLGLVGLLLAYVVYRNLRFFGSCCAHGRRPATTRPPCTSPSTTSSRTCSPRIRCSATGSTGSPSTTSSSPARRTSGPTRSTSRCSSRRGSSARRSSASSSGTCSAGSERCARWAGRSRRTPPAGSGRSPGASPRRSSARWSPTSST
jgi:hypothetical protein